MSTSYDKKTHKVKKGETLTSIAKIYKHSKWQNIWNAPENKAIVKKRKTPDAIQPGDQLIIPMNAAQAKAHAQEVADTQRLLSEEVQFQETLNKDIEQLGHSIKSLKKYKALNDKSHKELVVMLSTAMKDAKKWGSTVDAIAVIANLINSLTKLTMKAHKAAKVTGEALEKLNKEMSKDALDMAYSPIAKELKRAASKHVSDTENGYNIAIASVGIIWKSYDKMTSPSFWAWTAIRLKEGDSWSDAVTYDFQAETKQQIKNLVIRHNAAQRELERSIQAKTTAMTKAKKKLAESAARCKQYEKSLSKLEAVL